MLIFWHGIWVWYLLVACIQPVALLSLFCSLLIFFAGIATLFAQLITLCYYCCWIFCFCCFLLNFWLVWLSSALAAFYTLHSPSTQQCIRIRIRIRNTKSPGAMQQFFFLSSHVLPRLLHSTSLFVCLFVCQFLGSWLSVVGCILLHANVDSQLHVVSRRRSPLVSP